VHTDPSIAPQRPGKTDGLPRNVEVDLRGRYAAVRAGAAEGEPITLLHIGADFTLLARGRGAEPEAMVALAAGSRITAATHFRRRPPTARETEDAIAAIEDEVARALPVLATGGSSLVTTDATVRTIASLAGIPDQPSLSLPLDAMERVFARLAAVTLGRPVAREGIPDDPAFAATLLILRECMHHLKFPAVVIR